MLGIQLLGTLATIGFVSLMCLLLIPALRLVIKMRVSQQEELIGLDRSEHGERADYLVDEQHTIERYPHEFRGQLERLTNKYN